MEKNKAQEEHMIKEENICHMYCIEKTRRRTKNENEVCKYFETAAYSFLFSSKKKRIFGHSFLTNMKSKKNVDAC